MFFIFNMFSANLTGTGTATRFNPEFHRCFFGNTVLPVMEFNTDKGR